MSSVLGLDILVREVIESHARVVARNEESFSTRGGEREWDHARHFAPLRILAPRRLGSELRVVAERLDFEEHLLVGVTTN